MNTTITVTYATVIETLGSDVIILGTTLPEPCYPYTGNASIKLHAAKGAGQQYVKDNFDIGALFIPLKQE